MKPVLTPEQDHALVLVNECFGSTSDELLRFCRFLVEQKQGLKWLEEPVPACAGVPAARTPSDGH